MVLTPTVLPNSFGVPPDLPFPYLFQVRGLPRYGFCALEMPQALLIPICLVCGLLLPPVLLIASSFFKILGKAKPQLYRRKAAIPTREISRRFPADRLQLADPMGPCSFAPPACVGFADSIYRCVQYTILPQNCKRKAAIFIANCSKFLQILHRAGNIPVLRHIQMRIDLHCRSDAGMTDGL